MTTTRERQSAPSSDNGAPRWPDRSVFGERPGIPLWGAAVLALGLAVLGTAPDLALNSSSGWMSKTALFVGCLASVALVQRRSVFGPMVQPPLITLVIPLLAMVLGKTAGGSGVSSLALGLINPLINSFPMMALTSGLCLALGLARIFWLERAADSDDPEALEKTVASGKPIRKPIKKDSPKQAGAKEPGAKQGERGRRPRPEDRDGRRPRPEGGKRPAGESGGGRPRGQGGGQQGAKPRGGPERGPKPGGKPPERGPKPDRGGPAPGGRGAPPGRGAPGRGQPPRGGGGGRPAPGRGGQPGGEPPRRPRRPQQRGDDFFN